MIVTGSRGTGPSDFPTYIFCRRILGSYHILFFLPGTLLVTEEPGRAAFAARRLSVARTRDISGGVIYSSTSI